MRPLPDVPHLNGKVPSFKREKDNTWPTDLDYKGSVDLAKLTKDAAGLPLQLTPDTVIEFWLEATDNCTEPKPNVGRSVSKRVRLTAPKVEEMEKKNLDQQKNARQNEEKKHDNQQQQKFDKENRKQNGQQDKDKNTTDKKDNTGGQGDKNDEQPPKPGDMEGRRHDQEAHRSDARRQGRQPAETGEPERQPTQEGQRHGRPDDAHAADDPQRPQ